MSECPVTCGGGFRERTRTCDNPSPQHGGADCVGQNKQRYHCNTDPCPGKIMFLNTIKRAFENCFFSFK